MKQPLVLLHGWGVHSLIWNQVLPFLERDFEVTAIDLPGYGNDVGYAGEYSLDAIAKEVLSRAPDKAHWAGWSLGATIAIAAAVAHPERFLKLQLVSTTPRFLNGTDWEWGVDSKPYEALANDFDRDYEKAVNRFLLLQVATNNRTQFRESRKLIQELSQATYHCNPPSRQTLRGGLRILSETDLRPVLAGLKIETQVIAGRSDRVVPVEASRYLFSQLPLGHSLHVFESGHLPFLQAPAKYIKALSTFVNSTQ